VSGAFGKALRSQGKPAEDKIAAIFYDAGWSVRGGGNTPAWDLIVERDGLPFWLEIKNEDGQIHTGNLCIERYQGKHGSEFSGLYHSDAHAWVHTLGEFAVVYRAQYMRNWLHAEGYRDDSLVMRGDNGNLSWLAPIARIKDLPWCERCLLGRLPHSRVFWEINGLAAGCWKE